LIDDAYTPWYDTAIVDDPPLPVEPAAPAAASNPHWAGLSPGVFPAFDAISET
jgi:hypothetical protein